MRKINRKLLAKKVNDKLHKETLARYNSYRIFYFMAEKYKLNNCKAIQKFFKIKNARQLLSGDITYFSVEDYTQMTAQIIVWAHFMDVDISYDQKKKEKY